ncbi:MAG: hypothetical protein A2622_02725 [Bdellovibrionales bacterium RIFCSPHIGHO2_01_FULL_40_29]|nr:MAG: hypothetical protein A2622_02725 [Bdellovibrionales bacterium RIFCSPHIGHO2_01_FULL_40_29]OFZ33993.1 MAG: hypothetical protein A3D17_03145 [Bdellovibrionales bacterium RIFCSPHIGHO2_02_FULL_40_15]
MKFILFSFIFYSQIIFAADLYQQGPTARSLAMGGTYISFVRGADALFHNPSALARVDGFDFILGQVTAAYSSDAIRFVEQAQSTGSDLTLDDINGFYGLNSFADITARSGFVMPYFGVGFYSSNYILENFNNPPFPTFNATFISDYGYFVAGAFPIGPQASVGVTARHVKRWGGQQDILITSLVGSDDREVLENAFQDKGSGTAMDLSAMVTLPTQLNTTLTAVWKDVGRTTFSHTAGLQAPPSQAENLMFGVSIQHELSIVSWTHAMEYKFINTPDEDFSKKIHLGTEASFGLFDLRAGLNQGYLTYGGGVDLWFIQADVAYYSSELGGAAGQIKNDRVVYSLTLELDFDQSFKLNTMDGKKRRLKQRR